MPEFGSHSGFYYIARTSWLVKISDIINARGMLRVTFPRTLRLPSIINHESPFLYIEDLGSEKSFLH